jgi:plasmid maintenance system antidote protein VapI
MQHRWIRQVGGWRATALGAAPGEGLQTQAIATEGLNHAGVLTPLEQAHQPVTAAVEATAQTTTRTAASLARS